MILKGQLYTTNRRIIIQNQSSVTLFETPCMMHVLPFQTLDKMGDGEIFKILWD